MTFVTEIQGDAVAVEVVEMWKCPHVTSFWLTRRACSSALACCTQAAERRNAICQNFELSEIDMDEEDDAKTIERLIYDASTRSL